MEAQGQQNTPSHQALTKSPLCSDYKFSEFSFQTNIFPISANIPFSKAM